MKHPDATHLENTIASACPTTQHAAIILALRDIVGVEKYGKTVDENPLRASDWAVHALEECADGLKYAIRAREEAEKLEAEVEALRAENAASVEKVKRLEEESADYQTLFCNWKAYATNLESAGQRMLDGGYHAPHIESEWREAKETRP